ncbi:MAG: hypothetical protein KA981_03205 [Bacteroidia bacterium]|jgi:hypothetical protein|nr:hypothetical protein [Bacteroidia bacterium]
MKTKLNLGTYLLTYLLLIIISCKRDEKVSLVVDNPNLSSERIFEFSESQIEIFIDSVNSSFNRQQSIVIIDPDSAQDFIEEALNFSFSDVDTAVKNLDTSTFSTSFSINLNENNKFEFLDVANVAKDLASQIRAISFNSNLRFQFCRIDKMDENGNFEVLIEVGELDGDFDYVNFPTAPTVSANYLWKIDPYEYYSYIPCSTNDPYAPLKLEDEINSYLTKVASYRTRGMAIAAPFGYEVYYSNNQIVNVGGQDVFNYDDFENLSKFDFPIGILSFENTICFKSGVPFKSPIYGANPEEVACFVLFDPATYDFKTCINSIGMNYYIEKSLEVYDVLRPTNLNVLFQRVKIKAVSPIFSGDPLEHRYTFFTKTAKIRPMGGNTL